jgi:hypothetical protein
MLSVWGLALELRGRSARIGDAGSEEVSASGRRARGWLGMKALAGTWPGCALVLCARSNFLVVMRIEKGM